MVFVRFTRKINAGKAQLFVIFISLLFEHFDFGFELQSRFFDIFMTL